MYTCPHCQFNTETPSAFCPQCGANMSMPQQPQQAYQQPIYQQPVYQQPVYPQYPQQSAGSRGQKIAGMILGISGFVVAILGFIYTIIFIDIEEEAAFIFGMMFSMISLPLSIVGMILSIKSRMATPGKVFGIIGTILSGIVLFIALILSTEL